MPRADFYLIAKPRFLDDPLLLVCELVKKGFATGQSILILARSFEQAEQLDEKLWEFDETALIVPPDTATPDRALVINLRDDPAPGLFERVLEVVPADEAQRAGSRARWKIYQHAGFELKKFDM